MPARSSPPNEPGSSAPIVECSKVPFGFTAMMTVSSPNYQRKKQTSKQTKKQTQTSEMKPSRSIPRERKKGECTSAMNCLQAPQGHTGFSSTSLKGTKQEVEGNGKRGRRRKKKKKARGGSGRVKESGKMNRSEKRKDEEIRAKLIRSNGDRLDLLHTRSEGLDIGSSLCTD